MQFNLTPRMAWIAMFCLVALLALMFGIGLLIGRNWAPLSGATGVAGPISAVRSAGAAAVTSATEAGAARLPQPALPTPAVTPNTLHN